MYLDVEAIFSCKSPNSECSKSSKVVSMGWKCAKNGFEMIQKHLESCLITKSSYENPGQRWVPVNIFCFDREYLLNYRRYGKTVNKYFVATSIYFSKMQKFLHFEVFKGVKRYDEKNCPFGRNRQFSHKFILLRSPNEVELVLAFLFLKGLWCV